MSAVPTMSRTEIRAQRRLTRSVWRQPIAIIGVLIFVGWLTVVVAAPVIAPHDPLALAFHPYLPPSSQNLFGTDELGRDVFSRVVYGARTSFPLAIVIVVLALGIGGTLGAIAGFFGGFIDGAIMRLTELIFAFPGIILAMAVTASFGPSVPNAVAALVLVSWPLYARVVRGAVLSVRHEDFVSASRLFGNSRARVLTVDVLPNVAGPTIVLATLEMGHAVLLLSALSFLGLGVRPPTPEWGSMVAEGALDLTRWWVGAFPGLAIMTAVLGFNLLGDTLRDRLDPRISTTLIKSN